MGKGYGEVLVFIKIKNNRERFRFSTWDATTVQDIVHDFEHVARQQVNIILFTPMI